MTRKTIVHQYFHPDILELQKELTYHSELMDIINEQIDRDPEIQLCLRFAAIAKYLNILLHDTYSQADLEKLAGIFVGRLREQRKVNPVDFDEKLH